MFIQRKELTLRSEAEVSHAAWNNDLAQKDTPRRPYVDTIATTAVHIPPCVTLDTVWDPCVGESKQAPVGQEPLPMSLNYVKRISINSQQSNKDITGNKGGTHMEAALP